MPNLNIENSIREQIKLSKKVVCKDEFGSIDRVAGFGKAFFNDKILLVAGVFDFKKLMLLEYKYLFCDLRFPYIPGLLSYRESPAFIEAYNKLDTKPDIILVPAHGILHPRRFGMASHIGLILDKPSIGIAKENICGKNESGKIYLDGEILGKELKTRDYGNPLIISVGNKISLKTATNLVKKMIVPTHKMPEPLHQTNKIAKKIKKSFEKND